MKLQFQLFVFCLLGFVLVQAQPYGNEWVDHDETYYKFRIKRDGLYRISQAALQDVGLGTMPASGFKLYHKGAQVPIFTTASGVFGANDYIEFYGTRNDGEMDEGLFQDPDFQLTQTRSIISDSIAYFLTWNNSNSGQRYSNVVNELTNVPPAEEYFIHKAQRVHFNVHSRGVPTYLAGANQNFGDYEDGEGFSSVLILTGQTSSFNVSTPAPYLGSAPNAQLEVRLVGQSLAAAIAGDDHLVKVKVGDVTYINHEYRGYNNEVASNAVLVSALGSPSTSVTYESVNQGHVNTNSTAYTQLTYPRMFDLDDEEKLYFELADNTEKYLEITNFDGGTAPVLYDLTNKSRLIPFNDGGIYKIHLPAGSNANAVRRLYLSSTSTSGFLAPMIVIDKLKERNFTNFSNPANQGDYLMIYHESLKGGSVDQVQRYIDYRASTEGGNHTIVAVEIDQLYDQFAWGIPKHPLAIRHFVNFGMDTWFSQPENTILLGKSIGYNKITISTSQFDNCLIPTYGHHASDNLLVAREPGDYRIQTGLGRISARTPDEIRTYLDKVIEYEAALRSCDRSDKAWVKNVVHVGRWKTEAESNNYQEYLTNYENIIEGQFYGGEVLATYDEVANFGIFPTLPGFQEYYEDGLGILTFFGHSQGTGAGWQINIPQMPEPWNNEGRYPFIISGSCFVGNIHNIDGDSMAELYTLADNRGDIGFLATVSFGIPVSLDIYMEELYRQMSIINYGSTIGECIKATVDSIYISDQTQSLYGAVKITAEEFTLQADPAVVIGGFDEPDFVIENGYTLGNSPTVYNDVQVIDPNSGAILAPVVINELNTVDFQVTVNNIGASNSDNITIRIEQTLPNGSTITAEEVTVPGPGVSTTYTIPVSISPGVSDGDNVFTVMIDAAGAIDEICEENNVLSIDAIIQSCQSSGIDVTLSNVNSSYCSTDGPVTLLGEPAGGVFSGPGINNGVFYPSSANVGDNVSNALVYTYIDDNGCSIPSEPVQVVVNEAPVTSFSTPTTTFCVGQSNTITIDNFDSGVAYDVSLSGAGSLENNGNGSYEVSWDTEGDYMVSVSAVGDGCNGLPTVSNILVISGLDTPAIGCENTNGSSVTYSWDSVVGATAYEINVNGTLIEVDASENTYTVSGLPPGFQVNASITALSGNDCGNSIASNVQTCFAQDCATLDLSITNISSTYCTSDAPVALTANQGGGVFLINGNAAMELDPSTLIPGSHTVVYQVDDGMGCVNNSQTYTINIDEGPSPDIQGNAFFCQGETTVLSIPDTYIDYDWNIGDGTNTLEVTTEGVYTVSVTNANGCMGVASIAVDEIIPVDIEIETNTGNADLPDTGGNLTLAVAGVAGTEDYQWSTLATTPSISITNAGIYAVTVTDGFGCSSVAELNIFITGVEEEDWSQNVQLLPNPATNEALLQFDLAQNQVEQVRIFDLTGRLMQQQIVVQGSNAISLDLTAISNGVYFVALYDETNQMIAKKKLVVVK